jgi:cell division protein FtsZ
MSEMGMAMMGTGYAKGENRARMAAEKAISSPLLDDINLAGARGILVNITAGFDLSLGEFSEVGETIEEFASEEATVVVGTVIDPSMKEEIKVTVVATGLSGGAVRVPLQIVDAPKAAPMEDLSLETDYSKFDRPPAMRNAHRSADGSGAAGADSASEEYFDIPAFLRRQAD